MRTTIVTKNSDDNYKKWSKWNRKHGSWEQSLYCLQNEILKTLPTEKFQYCVL